MTTNKDSMLKAPPGHTPPPNLNSSTSDGIAI